MNSGAIGIDFGIHTKVYELIDWIKKDHRAGSMVSDCRKTYPAPSDEGACGLAFKKRILICPQGRDNATS